MKRLISTICASLLLLIAPHSVSAQSGGTVLEKDFALMMQWFPGRYDNSLQVFWEPSLNVAEEDRHERIHSIFKPVDLPGFPGETFYVEQYLDGDPSKIYRQRVYDFSVDPVEDAIRLKIYTPGNPKALAGAHRNPDLLKGLRPEDLSTRAGCDVFWKRQANQFLGYMKEGACRYQSKRLGAEIVISDDLVLTENEIWIKDRAETVAGEYVFGNKADVAHKLRKIRPFKCWAGILRGAKHGDSGKGQNDWDFRTGLWFHDQQGEINLTTDETPSREIKLRLRRVEWPTGNNRPSLTLYVHEGGSDRATSYAWAEYNANRVGLNLRWIQASCTHDPSGLYNAF